jgi:hypothetical protein
VNNYQSGVPNPITLLAIQAGGGLLTLLPISRLKTFAKLDRWLTVTLTIFTVINIVASVGLLLAFQWKQHHVVEIGQLELCRIVVFYDTVLLGLLVYSTGGAEKSIFAPQFAAVLPMAMLIPDSAGIKWAYAAIFLLMFLLGLFPTSAFQGYTPEELSKNSQKLIWFLVFFFLFTIFPVVYSIMGESDRLTVQ